LKEGVEMRFGCQVKEVDQAVPAVTLQDGTKLEADLIVAADGISILIWHGHIAKRFPRYQIYIKPTIHQGHANPTRWLGRMQDSPHRGTSPF
jgi:hypothetical protein